MAHFDIVCGNCLDVLREVCDSHFDMCVTSPPYDNMRTYRGTNLDFTQDLCFGVLSQIYRTLKVGGVAVWIVGDQTVDGGESLSSFRQAIYAQSIGFRVHDTMIWNKGSFTAVGTLKYRYASVFEYMFVLSKGKPKTFHPIKDRVNKCAGKRIGGTIQNADGTMKRMSSSGVLSEFGQRYNIWNVPPDTKNKIHPAPFPTSLVEDLILSWSNAGDLVLDPFCGSGTTGVACRKQNRDFYGIDISEDYVYAARSRIDNTAVDPRKVGSNDTKRPNPQR